MRIDGELYRRLAFKLSDEERRVALDLDEAEPLPDVAVEVPHLQPCTDSSNHTLQFNSSSPVTVLVHGCNGSAGRFRSLAQLYAFHGQQTVCFSYNDRDSLVDSSGQLITALDELVYCIN
jgi:hypothetical protein